MNFMVFDFSAGGGGIPSAGTSLYFFFLAVASRCAAIACCCLSASSILDCRPPFFLGFLLPPCEFMRVLSPGTEAAETGTMRRTGRTSATPPVPTIMVSAGTRPIQF